MELELNHFFNKSVYIYQSKDFIKVSMDTILLSASVNLSFIKNKELNILDVGSGIGGGDVFLAKRLKSVYITGIDIQEDLVDIARRNIKYNSLEDRVFFSVKDIRDFTTTPRFNWVITNPPFHLGSTSPVKNKSLSYTESDITLYEWIKYCSRCLYNSGYFSIIHKASRLDDIITILKKLKFGNINIFPVFTKENDLIAKRIIIVAKKNSKTEAILHKEISGEKLKRILNYLIDIY